MLDDLIAERDMRRLLVTYARAADRLDRDLLPGIFHEGAQVDLGAIYKGGVAGFVEVVMGFMGQMAATRHMLGNMFVERHGPDAAAAETQVSAWHRIDTPDGTRELTVFGRYLTRFERREGRWGIVWHSEVIDWGRDAAADPTWFDGNGEMDKGRRDRSDASYAALTAST
jgi:hypothetical protein